MAHINIILIRFIINTIQLWPPNHLSWLLTQKGIHVIYLHDFSTFLETKGTFLLYNQSWVHAPILIILTRGILVNSVFYYVDYTISVLCFDTTRKSENSFLTRLVGPWWHAPYFVKFEIIIFFKHSLVFQISFRVHYIR